jgi:hypothetical protein
LGRKVTEMTQQVLGEKAVVMMITRSQLILNLNLRQDKKTTRITKLHDRVHTYIYYNNNIRNKRRANMLGGLLRLVVSKLTNHTHSKWFH